MKRAFYSLCAALMFAAGARAQLTGQVSATTVAPSEIFTLTITAEGSNLGQPILPDTADFIFTNARNPSVSNSSSMQIINGQVRQSRSRAWTYQIHIDKEGEYSLPSIRVQIDGKEYATEPLKITVTKNPPRPQQQQRRRSPFDMLNGIDPFAMPPAPVVSDDLPFEDTFILELKADKTEVFVGEGVTVTMTWGQLDAGGVQVQGELNPPKVIQGFYSAQDDDDTRTYRETRNRATYRLSTKKQVWFPTAAGDFVLPGYDVPFRISRYTSRGWDVRTIAKKTEDIRLHVKALPPAPAGFSGAVGKITFSTSLPTDLLQGSQVSLSIRFGGQGNPASISAPELPALDWAHVSAATADQDASAQSGLLKVFNYNLTPLQEGPHELPELKVLFFSPESGQYETAVAQKIQVNVRKAVETSPVIVGGPAAAGANPNGGSLSEIHPIIRETAPLAPARSGGPVNGLAVAAPPVAYAALLAFVRHRRRLTDDKDFAREYYAKSKSQKRLARVHGAKDPTEELFHAVAGFVADKLKVPEAGMTSVDARAVIAKRGLPAELAANIEKILRACERARYAGVQLSETELSSLLEEARAAMDELEGLLKKGGAK